MKLNADSVYVAVVALICAHRTLMSAPSEKARVSNPTGFSGGTFSTMPVLPALKPIGEMKCQEIRPEDASPGSHACPLMTAVPSASVRPLKIEATTVFCAALRHVPSRAAVQVG